MSVCWKLKYARTMCNINTRCLHDTVDICISFIQGFLLNLIVSFSTNSSLVGPCSLASLFHTLPPCWSSYRSSFNRSSIFSGLRRRSYAKQAKLRHYPLANQRFLRSVRQHVIPWLSRWPISPWTVNQGNKHRCSVICHMVKMCRNAL